MWETLSEWVLGLCWGLFGLVWLAGAAYNAWKGPRVRTRSVGGYVWIVIGAAVWWTTSHLPRMGGGWATADIWWVRLVGLLILLAATGFTLWARGVLGAMWSSAAVVKDAHVLRTDGPYAIVRHPIYTGLLGMLLGTVLVNGLGLWIAVLVAAGVLFFVKIYSEERLLLRIFGADYERYRQTVPQIVPGLPKSRR